MDRLFLQRKTAIFYVKLSGFFIVSSTGYNTDNGPCDSMGSTLLFTVRPILIYLIVHKPHKLMIILSSILIISIIRKVIILYISFGPKLMSLVWIQDIWSFSGHLALTIILLKHVTGLNLSLESPCCTCSFLMTITMDILLRGGWIAT